MSEKAAQKESVLGDNFLTKIFTKVVEVATIGLVCAVAWQIFLDPIFFPIFHDTTNATAQAFVHMIHSTFSWIPDLLGLTGNGGLLHTGPAQSLLQPFYDATQLASSDNLSKAFDGGYDAGDIIDNSLDFLQ